MLRAPTFIIYIFCPSCDLLLSFREKYLLKVIKLLCSNFSGKQNSNKQKS